MIKMVHMAAMYVVAAMLAAVAGYYLWDTTGLALAMVAAVGLLYGAAAANMLIVNKKRAWLAGQMQVLEGARVELHGVEKASAPLEMPRRLGAESMEPVDYRWYWIEATITPRMAEPNKSLWFPRILNFVDRSEVEPRLADRECGQVHRAEVWREGRFESEERVGCDGAQRVRLLAFFWKVPSEICFGYFGRVFGEFSLPATQV